jgi:hypothetical protein
LENQGQNYPIYRFLPNATGFRRFFLVILLCEPTTKHMNHNYLKPIATTIILIALMPILMIAQNQTDPASIQQRLHNETPDDRYLAPGQLQKQRTQAYRFTNSTIFTTQVNVDAQGQNIVGDAANEPSIAVNPLNPQNMVIGWRQFDNVLSNFRQAGYGFTIDDGLTWTFPGSIDAGTFRSDPVLECNAEGVFHYNSLTSQGYLFTCRVFRSTDGEDWDDGVEAHGGDKQWMVIDTSNGIGTGNIYSYWSQSYSSCLPGFGTRSIDGGNSYEDCFGISGNPYWGTMDYGPNGELYIVGAGLYEVLTVAKSSNAPDPGATVTWDFAKEVYIDGNLTGSTPINPVGLLGQADIAVDRSGGPGHGNVYVLASVERTLAGDPADVMFSRSTDGGETWSTIPTRINDDPENNHYQWFGTMSVAPNGRIDVIWLDTRDAPSSNIYMSALYYSFSEDQGMTWSPNERLSDLFDPKIGYPQQDKMGDYFDIKSDNEGAHLAWANTFNGEQDVYYSFIQPSYVSVDDKKASGQKLNISCYPNPCRDHTVISFTIPEATGVTIELINLYGQVVEVVEQGMFEPGIYRIDYASDHLAPGYYTLRVSSEKTQSGFSLIKVQ